MRALVLFMICSLAGDEITYCEIIDRIAIAVGNQAITETAIDREIRLSSVQNGVPPDYSVESRRKAADRLIEQSLIRREMTFGNYPPVAAADVDAAFANLEKARGGEDALAKDLTLYGLAKEDLRSYLQWQLELLRFIDLRFRPAVQVSRQDVDKYYRTAFGELPAARTPEVRERREQIEDKLTGERADAELDRWLADQRSRTTIRFLDPSLGATAAHK